MNTSDSAFKVSVLVSILRWVGVPLDLTSGEIILHTLGPRDHSRCHSEPVIW